MPSPINQRGLQDGTPLSDSGTGMVQLIDLAQSLISDMGIYLSGGDITVAEQHLHYAQIRAMIEQVRRERVP